MRIYSVQLSSCQQEDILAAIRQLMLTRRQPGETAFPDLATVDQAVKEAGVKRRCAEVDERRRIALEAEDRHRKEHPEEYSTMADVVAEVARRGKIKLLESKKSEEPKRPYCEHCNGVQLSVLRPQDLRALAGAMEKQASQ
jgi:hypothetical protein